MYLLSCFTHLYNFDYLISLERSSCHSKIHKVVGKLFRDHNFPLSFCLLVMHDCFEIKYFATYVISYRS